MSDDFAHYRISASAPVPNARPGGGGGLPPCLILEGMEDLTAFQEIGLTAHMWRQSSGMDPYCTLTDDNGYGQGNAVVVTAPCDLKVDVLAQWQHFDSDTGDMFLGVDAEPAEGLYVPEYGTVAFDGGNVFTYFGAWDAQAFSHETGPDYVQKVGFAGTWTFHFSADDVAGEYARGPGWPKITPHAFHHCAGHGDIRRLNWKMTILLLEPTSVYHLYRPGG